MAALLQLLGRQAFYRLCARNIVWLCLLGVSSPKSKFDTPLTISRVVKHDFFIIFLFAFVVHFIYHFSSSELKLAYNGSLPQCMHLPREKVPVSLGVVMVGGFPRVICFLPSVLQN